VTDLVRYAPSDAFRERVGLGADEILLLEARSDPEHGGYQGDDLDWSLSAHFANTLHSSRRAPPLCRDEEL
jgi:hypothetical protein